MKQKLRPVILRCRIGIILALALSLIIPSAAFVSADNESQTTIAYENRVFNNDGTVSENTEYCDGYIRLSSLGNSDPLIGGKWYVTSTSYWPFTSRMYIEGNEPVNIILTDGAEVVFLGGINVASVQTLNIYGQSNDSGIMECTGDKGDAAIGGAEGQSGGACGANRS